MFELIIAVDQQTLSDGPPSAADLAHSQTWGSCDSDEKETLPLPPPAPEKTVEEGGSRQSKVENNYEWGLLWVSADQQRLIVMFSSSR